MSGTVENPYAHGPGSSTPGAGVSASDGRADLWGFAWLSVASTVIITVVGLVAWWFAHKP
ncbi:MAG: hypothetical protein L3K17_10375 [Thermoplasmata archaeon]|nr:hypothetical protein [Thermoplasmata archaeon]